MPAETREREDWIARNHAQYMLVALRDIARGGDDGKPIAAKAAQDRARRALKNIGLGWPFWAKPKR